MRLVLSKNAKSSTFKWKIVGAMWLKDINNPSDGGTLRLSNSVKNLVITPNDILIFRKSKLKGKKAPFYTVYAMAGKPEK